MPLMSGRPGTVVFGFQLLTKFCARLAYCTGVSSACHSREEQAYLGAVIGEAHDLGHLRDPKVAKRVLRQVSVESLVHVGKKASPPARARPASCSPRPARRGPAARTQATSRCSLGGPAGSSPAAGARHPRAVHCTMPPGRHSTPARVRRT